MPDNPSSSLWGLNTASVFMEAVDVAARANRRAATKSKAPTRPFAIGRLRRLATSALALLLLAGIAFASWIA